MEQCHLGTAMEKCEFMTVLEKNVLSWVEIQNLPKRRYFPHFIAKYDDYILVIMTFTTDVHPC